MGAAAFIMAEDPKMSLDVIQLGYVFVCLVIAITATGAGLRGYFAAVSTIPERILCFVAALLLFAQISVLVSISERPSLWRFF